MILLALVHVPYSLLMCSMWFEVMSLDVIIIMHTELGKAIYNVLFLCVKKLGP